MVLDDSQIVGGCFCLCYWLEEFLAFKVCNVVYDVGSVFFLFGYFKFFVYIISWKSFWFLKFVMFMKFLAYFF